LQDNFNLAKFDHCIVLKATMKMRTDLIWNADNKLCSNPSWYFNYFIHNVVNY